MCVQELRNRSKTCTVLCLWSWVFHELQDCHVLQQRSWYPEISWYSLSSYLGNNATINVSLIGDSRICSINDSIGEHVLSSWSVDWSGSLCTRRSTQEHWACFASVFWCAACAISGRTQDGTGKRELLQLEGRWENYITCKKTNTTNSFSLSTNWDQKVISPCSETHWVSRSVGFLRADSMNGCTGFSVVPMELYGRVTSVTCVGLVWSRISVSEFGFWQFHNFEQCFRWHGVHTELSQNCWFDNVSILGPVRSSSQMCTQHQELVFFNVCSAPFDVRSLGILWNRAIALPVGP